MGKGGDRDGGGEGKRVVEGWGREEDRERVGKGGDRDGGGKGLW